MAETADLSSEVLEAQAFKRKFAELVNESINVEAELKELKKQKSEWMEEREFLINKLATAYQILEGDSSEQVKKATQRKAEGIKFSPAIVATLDNWFTAHTENPYPTKEEKEELSKLTGLATKKVENWFINARRRRMKLTKSKEKAASLANAANSAEEKNHNNNNNNNNNDIEIDVL